MRTMEEIRAALVRALHDNEAYGIDDDVGQAVSIIEEALDELETLRAGKKRQFYGTSELSSFLQQSHPGEEKHE